MNINEMCEEDEQKIKSLEIKLNSNYKMSTNQPIFNNDSSTNKKNSSLLNKLNRNKFESCEVELKINDKNNIEENSFDFNEKEGNNVFVLKKVTPIDQIDRVNNRFQLVLKDGDEIDSNNNNLNNNNNEEIELKTKIPKSVERLNGEINCDIKQQIQISDIPNILKAISSYKPHNLSTSELKSFLLKPLPKGKTIQTNIKCFPSNKKNFSTTYNLIFEINKKTILYAKKEISKNSSFIISVKQDQFEGDSVIGKLYSNFVGTIYELFEKLYPKEIDKKGARQHFATITYEANLFGMNGPRKMKVYVPLIDNTTNDYYVFKPKEEKENLHYLKKNENDKRILKLINNPPKWSEKTNSFVLDFNGRVKERSPCNFQLVNQEGGVTFLQFGQTSENNYILDFQYPLNFMQALGICLSSIDTKYACN